MELRQATRAAFLKGHQMGHWQEISRLRFGGGHPTVVDLSAVRSFYLNIPKVIYCSRCGRSVLSTSRGATGTALDYECDAPPIRTHIEISGLKQLGAGR